MKKLALGLCLALIATASITANAATIDWKNIEFTLRGADTTAVVDPITDYLTVGVLGNQTGQGTDNWNLMGALPAYLNQPGAFVEVSFLDSDTGNHPGGAAMFVDTNDSNYEWMFQGGALTAFSNLYLRNHLYNKTVSPASYDFNRFWQVNPTRTGALTEHTFRVQMMWDGSVDILMDNVLYGTMAAADSPDFFETLFLGTNSPNGETFSATFTDLTVGVVPEPATISLLGLGLAGLAARRIRRKK